MPWRISGALGMRAEVQIVYEIETRTHNAFAWCKAREFAWNETLIEQAARVKVSEKWRAAMLVCTNERE